ncbi:MAG: hypothetical protein ACE149_18760 [Armatimonadota bacterium]
MDSDYRGQLRRVGDVLAAVGILSVAYTVYRIANGLSYRIGFNVIALIAGILLLRGSLRSARVVAWGSAFLVAASAAGMLADLLLVPLDLTLTRFWHAPLIPLLGHAAYAVAMFWLLLWVYRKLTSPPLLAAMDSQQINYRRFTRRPSTGFIAGVVVLLIATPLVARGLRGPTADRALAEVRGRVGGEYKCCVTSLYKKWSLGHTHVNAVVTIYNDHEIRDVPVSWEE